jgi:hypothetical protein
VLIFQKDFDAVAGWGTAAPLQARENFDSRIN